MPRVPQQRTTEANRAVLEEAQWGRPAESLEEMQGHKPTPRWMRVGAHLIIWLLAVLVATWAILAWMDRDGYRYSTYGGTTNIELPYAPPAQR